LESFTASGGRLLVFYDPRLANSIYITSTPPSPVYLDGLLTQFGMVVMDGYLYNANAALTTPTDNWQFVSTGYVNSTELGGGRYVFFTPAAISGSGAGIYVDANLLGFGTGRYAVVLQRGNVTAVGTVTSFLPDFVKLGDNLALLGDLARWVCGAG